MKATVLPLLSCIFAMLFTQRFRLYMFCLFPLSEAYNSPSWRTNSFSLLPSTFILIRSSSEKLKDRYFCWFPAAIFVPLKLTPIWRLMGSPHKAFWPNISQTKYRADLILVEAFIKFNFFHFLDFGLSVWNGLHFYLQWRDSEYREYWFPIMGCRTAVQSLNYEMPLNGMYSLH